PAEIELGEAGGQFPGLAFLDVQAVEHGEGPCLRLRGQRHLEAQRADLLVQRGIEVTNARSVSLAAADENRCAAIAVTGGTAALLATELLAGARNLGPLAGGAGCAATLFELPGDDTVQNVGARLDTEYGIGEFHVARLLSVEGLYGNLHRLALLAFGRFGSHGVLGGRISRCFLVIVRRALQARRVGRV